MAPERVPVAVGLLVKMLAPVKLALASAPFEDEAISEEEELDAAAAMAKSGPMTPMEEIMAEYSLTICDVAFLVMVTK